MSLSATYVTNAREYVQRTLEYSISSDSPLIIPPLFPTETIVYTQPIPSRTITIIETAEFDPCSKDLIKLSICCNDAWISGTVHLFGKTDPHRITTLNRAAKALESQFLTAMKFSQESVLPEWPALSKIASLQTQI